MRLIIGIGTGRTGTHSLARLINAQDNTICFHELNPACMKWEGAEVTVKSMLREFENLATGMESNVTTDFSSPIRNEALTKLSRMNRVDVVGDIALYYLTYVPLICSLEIDVRIPCIRRDREETIRSFISKVKEPYRNRLDKTMRQICALFSSTPAYAYRNHWVEHDGSKWRKDEKWDKCFPKFKASDLPQAIGKYWDYYYETAQQLQREYPGKVRIFDIETLNSDTGQNEMLEFCGFDNRNVTGRFHTNVGD